MSIFSSCTFCVLKNQFNFYHHYLFHPQKFFFMNILSFGMLLVAPVGPFIIIIYNSKQFLVERAVPFLLHTFKMESAH